MLKDKKILFVDIDGVLKPWKCEFNFFDPAVKSLNEIIDKTDCELVVSSDWRITRSLSELQEIFHAQSIIKVPIAKTRLSVRYDNTIHDRPSEIVDFIDCMGIRTFAVIDDMPLRWRSANNEHLYKNNLNIGDMGKWFSDNFFQITDEENCLNFDDSYKVINHLNRKV
ncbi:hypothetical protein EBU94_05030 [bacterium]|nr:hypothetical protein [bacterium]